MRTKKAASNRRANWLFETLDMSSPKDTDIVTPNNDTPCGFCAWVDVRAEPWVLTMAEAHARVESTGERYWEAELYRLEGEVLLAAAGDGDRAEACYRRALEVAGRQRATSLEFRAALSPSRLGSSADAHQPLGEVVGRFTEGHDTADLRAAQTQLSLIHPPTDD